MLGAMSIPEVPLRQAIEALPAYVPGARPGAGQRLHKLSSNENPYPPLPGVLEAIAAASREIHRYPDMYATELTEAIAEMHGVTASAVVAGNGSVAVLAHVLAAVCESGDEVIFPWRSFEAYPILTAIAGASAVKVPLTADGRHDLAAMLAAITDRTRAIALCTPNNPTGPALRAAEARAFLAQVPPSVLVMVDEAYIEFVRDPDAADGPTLLMDYPNVVVLRTFSKAYGLAGLRVGYALAVPRLAAGIRAASTPFGVSGVAQVAAVASLAAREELFDRVQTIAAERDRVTAALADLGREVPDAQGNFVWLALGDRTLELAQRAQARGVLVRPFVGEGVRVSIGEPEANDAFLRVVREWA
jgi:histidinol-phosphate aminotransferase